MDPMPESKLLAHIYSRSDDLPGRAFGGCEVVVGPGDDSAVIKTPSGDRLLITTDQLIEGRHFEPETEIDLIARKAVARSVSDIAAMGGTPSWSLGTAVLPTEYAHADELFDAMFRWAMHWECPLIGGDVARGDGALMLTVTVAGTCTQNPVLRSGAHPGQGVYVTGKIGNSFASGRHLTFEPRIAEAHALCAQTSGIGSMIDISDGLGRDAGRIAEASGVGIEIESALIPVHDDAPDAITAIGDGEDYELLFTADGGMPVEICGTPITRIGTVVNGGGVVMIGKDGLRRDAGDLGWDH